MLTGEKTRLRAIEKADIPVFVGWLNDLDVTENLGMWNPMSQVDEERWFEQMIENRWMSIHWRLRQGLARAGN